MVTRNCEGHPLKDIYLDKWLREESDAETFESLDDSKSCCESDGDKPANVREKVLNIQGWVSSVRFHRSLSKCVLTFFNSFSILFHLM